MSEIHVSEVACAESETAHARAVPLTTNGN